MNNVLGYLVEIFDNEGDVEEYRISSYYIKISVVCDDFDVAIIVFGDHAKRLDDDSTITGCWGGITHGSA